MEDFYVWLEVWYVGSWKVFIGNDGILMYYM